MRISVIKKDSILLLMLSGIFIYNTSTYLRSSYNFYLNVGMYVLFILLTAHKNLTFMELFDQVFRWFVACLIVSGIYLIHSVDISIWMTFVAGVIHIFFWSYASRYTMRNFEVGTVRRLISFNILTLIPCCLTTINVLNDYPLAARAMYGYADGINDNTFLFERGCGGFGFVYGIAFVAIALLALFKKNKKSTLSTMTIVLTELLFMYLVIEAGFSTALVFLLLGCCLMLIEDRLKSNKSMMMLICFLAIISIVFAKEILDLVFQLASVFGVEIVTDKMTMISGAVESGDLSSLARFQVYMKSIKGFISSPIFGSGTAGVDSQILSMFSYIGMFGMAYVVYVIKCFNRFADYVHENAIKIIELLAFVLAILNPFSDMTLMAMVFWAVPCILYLCQSEVQNDIE